MAGFRWPNGTSGHSISWQDHLNHLFASGDLGSLKADLARFGPAANAPKPPGTVIAGAPATAAQVVQARQAAAPAPTFVPDAAYSNAIAGINDAYTNTVGGLNTQQTNLISDYGFDSSADPFSKVNELKRNYLNQGHYIGNSLAAQGQLYSSARTKALASNDRKESVDYAALRKEYDRTLASLRQQILGAGTTRDQATAAALADAMSREGVA